MFIAAHSDTAHEPRPRIEPGLAHPAKRVTYSQIEISELMPTPEVHALSSRSEGPSTSEPAGVVIYGYYTFVDSVLTMTGNDGVPVRDPLTGEM